MRASSITTRFAHRSVGRNLRRTALSVAGIGIGIAIALIITAWVKGEQGMFLRTMAETGTGHLRVAPPGWNETRDINLRLNGWKQALAVVSDESEIKAAAPRARVEAILAFGTRVTGVEMLGVDPQLEPSINRLVKVITDGRYLEPGDRGAAVVGKGICQRLEVELDDDLLVSAAGKDGAINSAMLRIVGVVETGSKEVDAAICHVPLADLEAISGYPGAGEVTMTVHDIHRIDAIAARLGPQVKQNGDLLTWAEIMPSLKAGVTTDITFGRIMVGVIVFIVLLGVTSAQLTAVLERKREFAVLAALGMRGSQIVRLLVMEAFVLGLAGAVLGLIIGFPVVYYLATTGFDFSFFYEEGKIAVSGILVNPILYADMGWWLVSYAFGLALASTIIASLYPAWFAVRIEPTSALRVVQ